MDTAFVRTIICVAPKERLKRDEPQRIYTEIGHGFQLSGSNKLECNAFLKEFCKAEIIVAGVCMFAEEKQFTQMICCDMFFRH